MTHPTSESDHDRPTIDSTTSFLAALDQLRRESLASLGELGERLAGLTPVPYHLGHHALGDDTIADALRRLDDNQLDIVNRLVEERAETLDYGDSTLPVEELVAYIEMFSG